MTEKHKAKTHNNGEPGRPTVVIDWDQMAVHASYQCSQEELAAVAGCSVRTFLDACPRDNDGLSFSDFLTRHRDKGNSSIRTRLYDRALKDKDPKVLIHYAKNHLGHTDKMEHSGKVTYAQIVESIPDDD